MDFADEVWMQFLINLSRHIDTRVAFTGRHSAQVAAWVRTTARLLGFDNAGLRAIYWAALLHDVGKIGVPDHILVKEGPLNEREWMMIRLHPIVGANIVRSQKNLAQISY